MAGCPAGFGTSLVLVVGSRNHGGPDWPTQRGNFRGKDMHGHARRNCSVSCSKMAEPIEILFELWTWVVPRNHVLNGVQISPCERAIFRGKDMPGHARQHSAMNCARMAEPVGMPYNWK